LLRYGDFFDLKNSGRPRSWIYCASIRTTHVEYLVVFIIVQNLIGIDAVVRIVWMF